MALCRMLKICAICETGWLKLRTYWMKLWMSPTEITPAAAYPLPSTTVAT